ncbi:MAG TPA: hypothetical protein VFS43_25245 [Polyangiaceae bacterium]|nr:hypothetical protein [Polyangiaceae bacterium]
MPEAYALIEALWAQNEALRAQDVVGAALCEQADTLFHVWHRFGRERLGRATLAHIVLTLKDGQIVAAREYHDTLYAKIVLIDGRVSNSPV